MSKTKDFCFEIGLGGKLRVREAAVAVYGITSGTPDTLARRVVDKSSFTIALPGSDYRAFYVVAEIRRLRLGRKEIDLGDRRVQVFSVFTGSAENVALSERLTVATAYCFVRFLRVGRKHDIVISDPHRALHLAYGMKNNFVATDGMLSEVIQNPPNGLQTNSFALFNFLANLVYYCLTTAEVYAAFTRLTKAKSLAGALDRLARDPFTHVKAIYLLISEREPVFTPSLPQLEPPATPVPDQWTLAVKVNDSGAQNFLIGGVGYVVFDKNDRAWLANNVRQGTPNSATFCVVLEPDGSPAPFSPLFGGGLLGAGFGAAIDASGENIYIGNFGWGATEQNPQTGSISKFSCDGTVLSSANGFNQGTSRVQGMAFDSKGNLWMSSWGSQDPLPPTTSTIHFESQNSAAVVYLDGDPGRCLAFPFENPYFAPFDVGTDDEGNAYVSNAGTAGQKVPSSVYKLRVEGREIRELARWESCFEHRTYKLPKGYEALRQVTVGPGGDVFVVGVASDRVIHFDSNLCRRGEFTKNVFAPWGITFDTQGVMYVANFGRRMTFESDDPEDEGRLYGVTVITNLDPHSAKLMTLPTGGAEVTLANGYPLYGNPETRDGTNIPVHSYRPLMRLTAAQIDRAGNLWACNNWKPSAVNDVRRGNPGGDGIVIFVGVAEPHRRA